jgi:hypothetical protein
LNAIREEAARDQLSYRFGIRSLTRSIVFGEELR